MQLLFWQLLETFELLFYSYIWSHCSPSKDRTVFKLFWIRQFFPLFILSECEKKQARSVSCFELPNFEWIWKTSIYQDILMEYHFDVLLDPWSCLDFSSNTTYIALVISIEKEFHRHPSWHGRKRVWLAAMIPIDTVSNLVFWRRQVNEIELVRIIYIVVPPKNEETSIGRE